MPWISSSLKTIDKAATDEHVRRPEQERIQGKAKTRNTELLLKACVQRRMVNKNLCDDN